MILYQTGNYRQADWNKTIAGFDTANLMQDWSYGEAKARTAGWQVERGLLTDGDAVIGAAQVLIKTMPVVGGGLAWINRGPLVARGADYSQLLRALGRHYARERGFYLRIAPLAEEGSLSGEALAAAGFRLTETPGWASAVLDLSPPPDALRQSLRANWRGALKKAERAGLHVARVDDAAGYEAFLAEYDAFLQERKIATTVTSDLLRALQLVRSDDTKMQCLRCSRENDSLGSVLIVRTGDTVEYLAGTLTNAARQFAVGQLLLWRAICDSREAGARRFDLGGMDPDITPKGIFDFKNGVGGKPYRLASEIETTKGGVSSSLIRWGI